MFGGAHEMVMAVKTEVPMRVGVMKTKLWWTIVRRGSLFKHNSSIATCPITD